jgi:hypothetical protein
VAGHELHPASLRLYRAIAPSGAPPLRTVAAVVATALLIALGAPVVLLMCLAPFVMLGVLGPHLFGVVHSRPVPPYAPLGVAITTLGYAVAVVGLVLLGRRRRASGDGISHTHSPG